MHARSGRAALAAVILVTGCSPRADQEIVNGRSIFQTGRDVYGVKIVAERPPLHDRCTACHGATGTGGVRFPDGAVSADLRHAALSAGPHPYTLSLLERAIATGIDNDGKALDPVMPRWRLSQQDLHDVTSYVLTLK